MAADEAKTRGDYYAKGSAHLLSVASGDVVQALLAIMHSDIARSDAATLANLMQQPEITNKRAYEIYSYHYAPLMGFHWGLTARMCDATGKALVPTYAFFRVYQGGDVCKVHADRPSCEHSLSMPLAYSDGKTWSFEIGHQRFEFPTAQKLAPADDFGDEEYSSVDLAPGNAILYQGVNYRHGRLASNPNRWSAHLFMHWVDTKGPYADWAFDRFQLPPPGDFTPLIDAQNRSR
ncbi:MAG: hypothetical protein JNL81_08110 [Hyphomonadaceae bacterium]|nr:hypothetical protein [Hyphomonadaceae bacterium]